MVDAVGVIAPNEHITEIGISQHCPEGVQALFQNLFPVCNKQQPAGFARVLFPERLVVQCRNHCLTCAGCGNHKIASITTDSALCLQLIHNLLLIGVRPDLHIVDFGIVAVEILLRLQRASKALPLSFVVVFELFVVPVKLEGGCHLVDGLRQIFLCDFGVPLQTACQGRIGKVGRPHIGRREAGVPVENIRLCMEAGDLGVVADFDLRVGELAQLLDCLHIGRAHIGGRDDSQLAAVLDEGGQLIHDKTQPAPLDKGNQHINPIAGNDLLFELRVHLRLVNRTSEQARLCNRGFRTDNPRPLIQRPDAVLPAKKRKKLLCPLCNRERVEVSFFCFCLDRSDNLIGQCDLRIQISAIIAEIVQPAFHHFGHILC